MTDAADIAVTGVSGGLGGRVARRLAERGIPQRMVARDPSRAPELPRAQTAWATYQDGEAMRRALDGVRTLFMVSGSEAYDRLDQHKVAIDAAVAAGVERVVYTSFLAAAPDATFNFARDHIANVAVTALLDPKYDGTTFDVTGPELITMDDIAQLLTELTGRLVRYEAETLDQAYASRANYGAPDWE